MQILERIDTNMTWDAKLTGHPDSVVKGPSVKTMLESFVQMLKTHNITATLQYSDITGNMEKTLKKAIKEDEDSQPA